MNKTIEIKIKKMTTKLKLFALLAILSTNLYGQEDTDALFSRLQGVVVQGIHLFNVDGISITAVIYNDEFSTENSTRALTEQFVSAQLSIENIELTASDGSLGFNYYYVSVSTEDIPNIVSNTAYYFVADAVGRLMEFAFTSINKRDVAFERHFVYLFRNGLIPDSILVRNTTMVSSFNFAGRTISLPLQLMGRWITDGRLRTFADGGMDWSVHKTLEDAQATINDRFVITSHRENAEIILDTTVDIFFEGTETTARKKVVRFTDAADAMFTLYYVAAPVRGNYVSAIMSFWTSDQINAESGLPFLLEQVMELR